MKRPALLVLGLAAIIVGYHDTFGFGGRFAPWSPLPTTYTPALMIVGSILVGHAL